MSAKDVGKPRKKGKKKFSVVRLLLILVFAGVFAFSLYKVAGILLEYKAGKDIYEEVREVKTVREVKRPAKPVPEPVSSRDFSAYEHEEKLSFLHTNIDYLLVPKYSLDFDALLEINPEVIGWILIEDTYVDYPVVQGADNVYYLRHAASGEANNAGSIFADHRNKAPFSERNTILYGHNQRNLQMFHELLSYQNKEYMDQHPYVNVYLPDGSMLIYRVYSCHIEAGIQSYTFQFADDQAFMEFAAYTRETSLYDTGVPLFPDSRILTLVTCTDDADENRVVVHAVLQEHVPAGE